MIRTFERDGILLQYPGDWTLEAGALGDGDDGAWAVTVQSPETAFLLVALRPDADTPIDLADQTLETLKAEYKELDAEAAVETIAGRPAVGHDIDFLTVDTTVTCWSRCLETPAGPLLLLAQTSEYDRDRHEPLLRAIWKSLVIADE